MIRRALVLARGAGTRMQRADPAATLSAAQERAARAGLKPLIPIAGRPFLDHVLDSLRDAGIADVGLVVAPGGSPVREQYRNGYGGLRLAFVVQDEPRGTAHAVACAADWAGGDRFLTLNADNLYPVRVLRALAEIDAPALPVFDRDELIASSNIPAERVRAFALVEIDDSGYLARIVEKPSADEWPDSTRPALVSMNLWAFDREIFPACHDVPPSRRGERELPEAVMLAVTRGMRLRTLPARGPVLDLSRRSDTSEVERRLSAKGPAS